MNFLPQVSKSVCSPCWTHVQHSHEYVLLKRAPCLNVQAESTNTGTQTHACTQTEGDPDISHHTSLLLSMNIFRRHASDNPFRNSGSAEQSRIERSCPVTIATSERRLVFVCVHEWNIINDNIKEKRVVVNESFVL